MTNTKAQLIKNYVHEVMNMEIDLLTLEKANKKFEEELIKNDSYPSSAIETAKKELNEANQVWETKRKAVTSKESSYSYFSKPSRNFFQNMLFETLPTLLILMICGILGFLLGRFVIIPNIITGIILAIVGLGIGVYLCWSHFFIWFNFDTKKKSEQHRHNLLEECASELKTAHEEERLAETHRKSVEKKLKDLKQNAGAVARNKKELIESQIKINSQNIVYLRERLDNIMP